MWDNENEIQNSKAKIQLHFITITCKTNAVALDQPKGGPEIHFKCFTWGDLYTLVGEGTTCELNYLP